MRWHQKRQMVVEILKMSRRILMGILVGKANYVYRQFLKSTFIFEKIIYSKA